MSASKPVQIDSSKGQAVDFEHLARVVISKSRVNCLSVRYLNGLTLELASFDHKPVMNIGGLEPAYKSRLFKLVGEVFGTSKGEEAHAEVIRSIESLEACSVTETGRTWIEVDPAARNPSELATRLTDVADALDCERIVTVERRSL